MFRNRRMHNCQQQGVSLIAAIFLILVVALLVAAIHRSVYSASQATSLSIMTHKALLTAYSGAQLSLNRLYAPSGVPACADRDWDMATVSQLRNCAARVSCAAQTSNGTTFYTVSSTGACTDGARRTQRTVMVRAKAD